MFKFHATKQGHEFYYTAPSLDHESVAALRGIGYDVKAIERLTTVWRNTPMGGGFEKAWMPTWVEVAS